MRRFKSLFDISRSLTFWWVIARRHDIPRMRIKTSWNTSSPTIRSGANMRRVFPQKFRVDAFIAVWCMADAAYPRRLLFRMLQAKWQRRGVGLGLIFWHSHSSGIITNAEHLSFSNMPICQSQTDFKGKQKKEQADEVSKKKIQTMFFFTWHKRKSSIPVNLFLCEDER